MEFELIQYCQCYYTMIQAAFFGIKSFSQMQWFVQFIIKILVIFEHNFFIFKFHRFMQPLNLITFKYSFFRKIF